MKMTIARAMKHRARVASRLSRVSRDIQSQNSYLANNIPEVDVKALMETRHALMEHLIDLRVSIDAASAPIKRHLFDLAEKKAQMGFFQQIDTKNGKHKQDVSSWGSATGGDSDLITYKAIFRKTDIDKLIVELETAMDALQDRLDQHNAMTEIAVEVPETFNRPHK